MCGLLAFEDPIHMTTNTNTETGSGANVILTMDAAERAKVEARFWRKTKKNPETGCTEWIGAVSGAGCGYGSVSIRGRKVGAHCVGYVLVHNRPIPPRQVVRHLCPDPLCVVHLTVGTPTENMQDAIEQGRIAHGSRDRRWALTAELVAVMRRLHEMGENLASLASAFAVSPSTVKAVLARRTWRHVPDLPPNPA